MYRELPIIEKYVMIYVKVLRYDAHDETKSVRSLSRSLRFGWSLET